MKYHESVHHWPCGFLQHGWIYPPIHVLEIGLDNWQCHFVIFYQPSALSIVKQSSLPVSAPATNCVCTFALFVVPHRSRRHDDHGSGEQWDLLLAATSAGERATKLEEAGWSGEWSGSVSPLTPLPWKRLSLLLGKLCNMATSKWEGTIWFRVEIRV